MNPFRVGLLAHSFHRRNAASLRSWHLGRALAREGVDLRVYCAEGEVPSGHGEVPCAVREVGAVRRGFADRADTVARVLHARFGWTVPLVATFHAKLHGRLPLARMAYAALEEAEAERPHDFLLAVWPDFEWTEAAARFSRAHRIPFAVEFQDPWAYFYEPRVRSHAHRALRRALDDASFTLNVCEEWCAADTRDFGLRSVCIPTGFWERPAPPRMEDPTRPLRIVYAGSLWYFDLRPLAEGLRLARDRGVPWRFEYFGDDGPSVVHAFEAAGVADQLDLRGRVGPDEVIEALSLADLLLLFTMPTKASTFGFKFAEVISRGVPVLLVGPDDPVVRVAAGKLVELHPCPDASSVATAVAQVAHERPILPKPNAEVDGWTWPALARRLVEAMKEAANRRGKT